MFGNLTGVHLLIVLAIVLLLFGATKLPLLARSVGQSMKIFKEEVKSGKDAEPVVVSTEAPASSTTASAVPMTPPVVTPDSTQKP